MEGHGHHDWNHLKQIEKKRGMWSAIGITWKHNLKKSDWDNGNNKTQWKGSMPQYL